MRSIKTLCGVVVMFAGDVASAVGQPDPNLDRFFESPYVDGAIPPIFVDDLGAVISQFVTPLSETKTELQDRQNPAYIDAAYDLKYRAMEAVYYFAAFKKEYYRPSLVLSDPGRRFRYGIRIGMSEQALAEAIGAPDRDTQTTVGRDLFYVVSSEGATVDFAFASGTLVSVKLSVDL